MNFSTEVEVGHKVEVNICENKLLRHVNFGHLNILSKNNLVEGLPNNLESEYMKCGTCIRNKMTNTSFKNNRHIGREIA